MSSWIHFLSGDFCGTGPKPEGYCSLVLRIKLKAWPKFPYGDICPGAGGYFLPYVSVYGTGADKIDFSILRQSPLSLAGLDVKASPVAPG